MDARPASPPMRRCKKIPVTGGVAIVCGTFGSRKRCGCGAAATLACDWKVASRRSGTCDAPLCVRCAFSPAEGKDLCPDHRDAYARWLSERAARRKLDG